METKTTGTAVDFNLSFKTSGTQRTSQGTVLDVIALLPVAKIVVDNLERGARTLSGARKLAPILGKAKEALKTIAENPKDAVVVGLTDTELAIFVGVFTQRTVSEMNSIIDMLEELNEGFDLDAFEASTAR